MKTMRLWFFAPFLAFLVWIAVLGLQLGQIPSDSALIDRFAARYVAGAPAGAQRQDCAAIAHPDPDLRLLIICAHPDGSLTRFDVTLRGGLAPPPVVPDL
jgi:hypothetical protein